MRDQIQIIKGMQDAADDLLQLWKDKESDIEMLKGFKEQWLGIDSFSRAQQTDIEINQCIEAIKQLKKSYIFIMNQIIEQCEK